MSEINSAPAPVSSESSPSDLMSGIMDTIDPGGSDSSSSTDSVLLNSDGELAPEADDEPLHPEDPDADEGLEAAATAASTDPAKPKAEAPKPATPDQPEWDEEVGAPKILKTSKGDEIYQWPKDRGQRIYEGYKSSKAYQEIAPTIEEARAHQGAFIDQMHMLGDLRGESPKGVDTFLGHWNKMAPNAVVTAAEAMVQHLPLANPPAYQKLEAGVMNRTTDRFYQEYLTANEAGNRDLAARYLFAAQSLDFLQNRPARDPNGITRPAPVNEREQSLRQREEALSRTQTQQESAEWKTWSESVNTGIRTEMQGELDKSLTPLKALKDANPKAYDRAVKDLNEAIREGLDADQNWNDLFNLRYNQSRRSKSDADRTVIRNQYLGRFRVELAKRAPGIVKEFTDTFMAGANARRAKVENSTSRKEVSGGAASSTKPVAPGGRYRAATDVEGKVAALLGL